MQILNSPHAVRRPRLILLSSLLTWAGKSYDDPIVGSAADFHARVPAVCAVEQYLIENRFFAMASSSGTSACILGMGLVYGGVGFDMKEIFRLEF